MLPKKTNTDSKKEGEPRYIREIGNGLRLSFVRNEIGQYSFKDFPDLIILTKRYKYTKSCVFVIVTAINGITDHLKPDGCKTKHPLYKSLGDLNGFDSVIAEGVDMPLQKSVGNLNVVSASCDFELIIPNKGLDQANDKG